MKSMIFSMIAAFAFTSGFAQIVVKPASQTTTVTTKNQPIVDFNKKQVINRQTTSTSTRTEPAVVAPTRRTVDFNKKRVITAPRPVATRTVINKSDGTPDMRYKENKKNKKWKKNKKHGHHDNRWKSKHHNDVDHDNRDRSKHYEGPRRVQTKNDPNDDNDDRRGNNGKGNNGNGKSKNK